MNKRTIIRVITWLPLGGIERRLAAVAPMLRDAGWNVRVVCVREEGPLAAGLRDAGIPVDVISLRSRLSPGGIRQLARYFRRHNASIVHAHMYRSYIPSSIAAQMARTPVMFGQIHNVDSWDNGRQALTDRLLSRFRSGTFVVSRKVQDDACARLRISRERLPILYNGIDIGKFLPDDELGEKTRRTLGIASGKVVFVVPARLHPQKNPGGVIAAAGRLAQRHKDRFVLLFAGEGKLREEIQRKIEKHSLGKEVRLLGARDDMKALYNAADAVVLSSFKEGFSNAIVEGLACGRPVIASDVGGNAEAIAQAPRPCGWIHEAGDTAALASQMDEAVRLGRHGLAIFREAATSRARDFSLEKLIHNTQHYYEQALAGERLALESESK